MTFPRPPSGQQLEIIDGDNRATIVTVGGGLRSCELAGGPVLDGYGAGEMADGARGQTLFPWPNRVRDGQWSWHGQELQLALSEPEQHNALHGLVRWVSWDVLDREADCVSLGTTVHPQPGYPWLVRVVNTYRLRDNGLTVTTLITNLSSQPVPVACGFHPYITVGTEVVDEALLHVPAEAWFPTGEQQIPTGREPVAGDVDFRQPRRIADTTLDYAYTDLVRAADGRFRLSLKAASGREVRVWLGEGYPFVSLYTGDTLASADKRRRSLGVEPMTAPPDAFNTKEGLQVLEPGAAIELQWGISATG